MPTKNIVDVVVVQKTTWRLKQFTYFFVLTTPRVQYSRFTASEPSYPKPLKGWTDRLAPAR